MKANIDYKLIQDNENALEISYKGIFHIDEVNNKYKLTYEESKVINTLEIDDNEKTIKIINQNELFFKKGLDKKVKYQTAYGLIPLRVVCNDLMINHDKENKVLEINLKYYLYQGNDPLINDLSIKVKY